jgi:TolA-binding protein
MARTEPKDLLTRLADAGEDAIHRISEAPGADRIFGAVNAMRDRTDELQKRVRGLEGIERRVADLERRLEALEGGTKTPAARSGSSSGAKSASTRARKTTSTSASSGAKSGASRRTTGSPSTRKSSG